MRCFRLLILAMICGALQVTCVFADSIPPMPPVQNNEQATEIETKNKISFYQKIKNFFSSKSTSSSAADKELTTNLAEISQTTIPPMPQAITANAPAAPPADQSASVTPDKDPQIVVPVLPDDGAQLPTKAEAALPAPPPAPAKDVSIKDAAELNDSTQLAADLAGLKKNSALTPPSPPAKSAPTLAAQLAPLPAQEVKTAVASGLENSDDMSAEQSKFVSDEAKVLLLPNDDVVLGKVSEQARLDDMEMSSYLPLVEVAEEQLKTEEGHEKIIRFIANYQDNFNPPKALTNSEASEDAFSTVMQSDLNDLRVLLDNYPVIQKRNDDGNTLLHITAGMGDYSLVKFLIMRGINLYALDSNQESALTIAQEQGNEDVAALLKSAGAR